MNLRQRTAEHRTAVRKTLADESINLKVWLNFRDYCIRETPIYRILVQINWRAKNNHECDCEYVIARIVDVCLVMRGAVRMCMDATNADWQSNCCHRA